MTSEKFIVQSYSVPWVRKRKADMVEIPLTSYIVDGQRKWKTVTKGEKSHGCNDCDFSTSCMSNLKVHMRRHNPEKLFKCDQCNYEGNQQTTLNTHVRSVHNDLWYNCEDCDFKASQKGNLKIHTERKHDGLRYACGECDHKATQ